MPAVPTSLPRLQPGGAVAGLGQHRQVIDGVGATRTLAPEESGALCLFDRAAGNVFTLPAPVPGMQFEFRSTVAVTSNASKVITDAATTFMVGSLMGGSLAVAEAGDVFQADGTTIRAVSMAGSTTGGLIGGSFTLTAISSTVWSIEGDFVGAGTIATPFATS